jgi:hypothetical protein
VSKKISSGRTRRAFRKDADQAAKLFEVQEKQIAALKLEIVALEAVLLGVCQLYVWDMVDMETGEVSKSWQK